MSSSKGCFGSAKTRTLFANLEKCVFCTDHVIFLSFVVSSKGIHVDEEKMREIKDWAPPKNATEVRSFHGLASFYRRFVKKFSTIAAPINKIVKKNVIFKWGEKQEQAFSALTEKLIKTPILASPKFSKSFEIECDASNVGIRVILMQEGHPIAYCSEKLKGAALNYSTYCHTLILVLKDFPINHSFAFLFLIKHYSSFVPSYRLCDHSLFICHITGSHLPSKKL